MTAAHAKQLVDGYLGRLELELIDLEPERRREIVEDLRTHIAEERAGLERESDADLMNLLDRLGDPAEIAAAARDGQSAPPPASQTNRVGIVEVLALVLTPFIWPAGVVLLWLSSAWTTKQKLIGTLVPPGGYPGVYLFIALTEVVILNSVTVCGGGSSSDATATFNSCPSPAWYQYAAAASVAILTVAALIAPVVVGIYLATRLRKRPA